MAITNKLASAVFLVVVAQLATLGPVQGSNQDKQEDQTGSNKQSGPAKQDNRDKQDSQDKQGSGEKQDKKDNSKSKGGTSTVTIIVLSDQQVPIKDAVVVLFTDNSRELKTTGADGKVAFQTRGGSLTLRITADHMDAYQKPLPLSGDQQDSSIRVVLNKSN